MACSPCLPKNGTLLIYKSLVVFCHFVRIGDSQFAAYVEVIGILEQVSVCPENDVPVPAVSIVALGYPGKRVAFFYGVIACRTGVP